MRSKIAALILLAIAFGFILPTTYAAQNDSPLQLYLDGSKLEPTVPPRIVKDTTMVPARIVAETLGANVDWNPSKRAVTIRHQSATLELVVNRAQAVVDGKSVPLDVAPFIEKGRALLPLRFIAENLGVLVRWDKPTRSINLWTSDPQVSGSDPATDPEVPDIPGGDYPALRSLQFVNNQLVVKASGGVTPNVFLLSNPDRLVVDIPGLRFADAFPAPPGDGTGVLPGVSASDPLISSIRYSLYDQGTSTIRIVADLKKPAAYQVVNTGDRNSLIVHMSVKEQETAPGSAVLIYHSHNRESFLSQLPGVTDPEQAFDTVKNVAYLGDRLAQRLRANGTEVFHAKDDYPAIYGSSFRYGKSYVYSEATVRREMAAHPQIGYLFDLHRDSSSRNSTTVTIGGITYARLYFVIGLENPDYKKNDAFAKRLQSLIEAKYPGLSRGIYYKDTSVGNGWYNQNLSPRSALIEIGGVYNTLTESYRTVDILADTIAQLRSSGY